MAKITISQLHTADAASIQELTNAELDATKGGLLDNVSIVIAPKLDLTDTAILGQTNTRGSSNGVLNGVGQNLLNAIL